MKKGLLLLLGMLMMVSTAEASDRVKTNSKWDYQYRYGTKPVKFFEKGIKFYVYPNGKFDFDTNTRSRYSRQYVNRNGRRYASRVQRNQVRIERDYFGKIRRVGNVFINYNRFGKISRIGNVSVNYRHRRMTSVGGLQIRHNRYGRIIHIGHVKGRYNYYDRSGYSIGSIFDYNDDFFYSDGFYDDFDDFGEDDDYYYYKSKGGKKGYKKGHKKSHKKGKIIKRKKLKKDDYYEKDYKERKRRK